MLVAWDTLDVADLPARAISGLPERTRIRRRAGRAARCSSGIRRGLRLCECQRRPATRPTIFSLPPPQPGRAARRHRAGRKRRPRHVPARVREHDNSLSRARGRDGAHRPCRSAGALRRRSRSRCRTSSRCAAIRPTSCRACPGSARTARRSCCASTARWRTRSRRAAFPRMAKQLRLFRSIATMDRKAPLPRLGKPEADLAQGGGARAAMGA